MATKTKRPGGNRGEEKVSSAIVERDLFTLAAAKREELPPGVTEHWLHVAHDGTEQRFNTDPLDRPALHVWSANGREYTVTFSREWVEDRPGWANDGTRTVTPVPPPGAGWQRCNLIPPFIKKQMSSTRPSKVWGRRAVRS